MSKARVAVLLLWLSGCSSNDATPPAPCQASVQPVVGLGTTPSLEWSPDCAAAGLAVQAQDGSGRVMWTVLTVGTQNTLAGPVHYGERPADPPVFTDPAVPLVAGTTYLLTVFRAEDAAGGPILVAIGSQEFVP